MTIIVFRLYLFNIGFSFITNINIEQISKCTLLLVVAKTHFDIFFVAYNSVCSLVYSLF